MQAGPNERRVRYTVPVTPTAVRPQNRVLGTTGRPAYDRCCRSLTTDSSLGGVEPGPLEGRGAHLRDHVRGFAAVLGLVTEYGEEERAAVV